jgi:hypothetical protein
MNIPVNTKNEEVIAQLGDYLILKEGPASCSYEYRIIKDV